MLQKQLPPSIEASSDEEQRPSSKQHTEEGVSSSEEASSQEEDDDDQPPTLPLASANPHPKPSSSDSDTDSEPTKVKPKPTDQAQKPQPSPAPPKWGSKRPAQYNAPATDPKRAKKKLTNSSSAAAAHETEEKSGGGQAKLSQRLFSKEDELAILKGMAEFISKTGQDPYKYADAFQNFVKNSLRVEASSNQIKEKIRRLKKKFETKAQRAKKWEDPEFSKFHDRTVFELSKKVWGEGANGLVEKPKPNNGKRKTAKTPKKDATSRNVVAKSETTTLLESMELEECGNVNLLYREVSGFKELNEDEMKRGLALIGESKRKELEGKWRKLRLAEMELVANRSLLIGEQIKLIFEALQ